MKVKSINDRRKRLTLEEFIEFSKQCHGNKYIYDKVQITSSSSKVTITCPEHGDFVVRSARAHYTGVGCPKCKGYQRNTLDSFIERSRAIHGEKYDYSKSNYVAASKKVIVICPLHSEFQVTPSNHYGPKKTGCPDCSGKKKLTPEEFINKCKSIHGNKYNYDHTLYLASNKKVTVNCCEHGNFEIRASDHMGGPKRGCPSCAKVKQSRKKVTNTEEFIKRSKEVHGDKYEYSKSVFKSARQKVVVTCRIHGDFSIGPTEHSGRKQQGCSKCAGRGEITTQSFIERSKALFGDRFSYEHVLYKNAKTKVKLTCKTHGDFLVIPANHYKSNGGCLFCSKRGNITTSALVRRLKQNWGEQYDYSKVKYLGSNEPVTIICHQHGEFNGLPQTLLKKQGCPSCYEYTKDDFIKSAIDLHGDQYDYSEVEYINSKSYLNIICPKHGRFHQRANTHLSGRGCPTCGVEKNLLANRDPNESCMLYYLTLDYKGHLFWKIGITTRDLERRYHLLHKDNVKLINAESVNSTIGNAINAESRIIKEFEDHLEYRGHILQHSKGGTETFSCDIFSESGKSLADYLS